MPLYSTVTLTNAIEGKFCSEPTAMGGSEVGKRACEKEITSWCYLFVHHAKVNIILKKLETQFTTFVHTRIIYRRENKHIRKDERPTISGLVFIQGDCRSIQTFLSDNFFGLFLVKDCSSGKVAAIPDSVMRSFMQVSQINPTRIRFMPHTFDYYSTGNPLIKITSGVLSGLEGYRIRISRDKCFVTSIGGMTVAIGGIYKESFENMDEYVRFRRAQLAAVNQSPDAVLTPVQEEIDHCFFSPQNQLDVMAVSQSVSVWIAKAHSCIEKKDFDGATEISLFLQEEIGSRFLSLYNNPDLGDLRDIIVMSGELDRMLVSLMSNVDVSVDLKEIIASGRESLAIRFPFLQIDL